MPKWLKRIFGRQRLGQLDIANKARAYSAAATNRLTNGWNSTARPAHYDIRRDFNKLVARVRDLSKNNDYIRQYSRLVKTNVVGPQGIVVQSRVPSTRNGTETIDKLAADAVEQHFRNWGKYGSPDVTGQHSWISLQNQVTGAVATEGEALIRRVKGWSGNKYRYALQVLDVIDLPADANHQHMGNQLVMGIEMNDWGRPVAYHFVQRDVTDETYKHNGRNLLRVPADQLLHIYFPELVMQTRGVSPMTSAMLRLNMLEGYEEAAVVAARLAASTMGFFVRADGSTQYQGDYQNDDGSFEMSAEPGTLRNLPDGITDVKMFDTNAPHEQYGAFVKSVLRGISGGLGVSYNKLANDLEGVNFSSLRAGELEDREAWKCFQRFMIERFIQPVFEDFVEMALLSGELTINGKKPNRPSGDYMQASYQGRRWAWVDPLKDAQHAQLLLQLGLANRSEIIRDMGKDPQDVWDGLAQENELLESMGIPTQVNQSTVSNDETDQT